MIIGTAGHIDHGKTSLVKLLTGIDTDRLPEEKKRGITIDLGFAYTQGKNDAMVGFVDVPGHEKFVHTMVAGAVGMDYGLLVIAADDGIMPQTIEHLRILELLGVSDIFVAITKIDMVDQQQINTVQLEVENLLTQTIYLGTKIFKVSNTTQEGVAILKDHLFNLSLSNQNNNPYFRLAIDRVFISKGMGVTVTGAIQAGEIAQGDQLLLMPQGIPVKVRSIHAQSQSVDHATFGSRCGIVLSGVDLEKVQRGDWLVAKELDQEVDRFDALIKMPIDAKQKIRDGEILLLHHGTDHTSARLILLDSKEVTAGQSAMAQLVLQKPLSMCWSDRFILRDMSARYSLAGGQVLDITPPQRSRKTLERLQFLNLLLGDHSQEVFKTIIHSSKTPVSLDHWVKSMNQSPLLLKEASKDINAYEIVSSQQTFYIDDDLLKKIEIAIVEYLQVDEKMVGIDQLRGLFKPRMDLKLFKVLLDELIQLKKIFMMGSKYTLSIQGITFSESEKIVWDKAVLKLRSENFNPPLMRDIAKDLKIPEVILKNVFKKATQQQLLVWVGSDIYYLFSTMKEMATILQDIFDTEQQITVVEFRNRLQIGRNRVVLIIEAFDKIGFTLRIVRKDPKSGEVHDFRIIKNKKVFM
jgi:selenocysteine-specific elongation factor